jgi:diguanylate cyclase (GGDEF)-like protein
VEETKPAAYGLRQMIVSVIGLQERIRMTNTALGEATVFLANSPAGRGERRSACAVIAASTIIFVVLVPFAKVPLTPTPSFIAIYQSALVINDLITAVFLLGQSQFARSRALRWLAGGYLFTALASAAHALTFPGLFSLTGLLDAGPQTTAWMYIFWHSGFPLLVIAYARRRPERQGWQHDGAANARAVGLAIAVVCAFTLFATAGQDFLPAIMAGDRYTPIAAMVISSVWLLSLFALTLVLRRRPYSVLDLWLIVTMCAWLFDIALSAVFNSGRYDLGFYAGRIYGLVAASLVLIVLLFENTKLYVHLISLRESDRAKATELHRLTTVDTLTGIANRRAFEEALDQEWRRMMRHEIALSLLMIDVDCFKRFNDTYGHVAGDQCLRAVAQTLAGRTRRAGEMAARYGGEEFAVLLPHCDIEEARKLAVLICESVGALRIPHEGSAAAPYVTVSIGVASIGEVPHSAAALSREGAASAGATVLIETADAALYRAKTSGRNRAVVAGMDDAARASSVSSAA